MIQKLSKLKLPENSGAQLCQAINLKKNYKNRYTTIGHIILVSVKKLRLKKNIPLKIKKKNNLLSLIITTKKYIKKSYYFKFYNNNIILLNFQGQPYATNIFIPLLRSLYFKGFLRLGLISPGFFPF